MRIAAIGLWVILVPAGIGLVAVVSGGDEKAGESPRPSSTTKGVSPLPERSRGIAAEYVGDKGIGKDRAVLYATSFENGIEGGLKKRRAGVSVVTDPSKARTGNAFARITATRGKDTGGDLKYMWKKGVDQCFVRFYCRFDKGTVKPHHFVNMGGNTPTYKYRWGGAAGLRPPGGANGAFGTTIEPPGFDQAKGKRAGWSFYTYWHEMRSWQTPHGASTGRPNAYYGNVFRPDKQRAFAGREKWICVEFMVKMNTIGKRNGEQAFWIDGKKIGHWAPGRPVGTWIRERFVTSGPWNKNPKPFEGFSWRTDKRLSINKMMLQWYVSPRAAKDGKQDKNTVYFDNLVIATEYIGPIAAETTKATPLFSEHFDDAKLKSRKWYDMTRTRIVGNAVAGKGCIEYEWTDKNSKGTGSSHARRLFKPTDEIYLRFYLKLSKGWGWTGRNYHPHLVHFLTTENSKYHEPAASHLTLYVEPVNGKLRLGATDIRNQNMPHGLTQGRLKGGYNGKLYDSKEVLFKDDKWHCIEAYFKLNTLDLANDKPNKDGIVRGWFDGKLVVEHTDVILRSTDFPKMKFNQFLMAPYFGPGLLPHAQKLWIDELAVGTKRIGPLAGGKAVIRKDVP